ncbi:MAG: glycosyltransferase family 39 protein, partial [Bacteroidota bacterium]
MISNRKNIYLDKVSRKHLLLGAVILLAAFFSFWKSGKHSLYEWDESRYGMIAYQMIQHHDFINYYFLDEIDPTVYKPPLSFWAIAGSYKIFGANEFALRFPSSIATILFFIFFFLWICIYKSEITAMLACLILLGVKGIIGTHIGRTGDTEAMLICFQMISVYFFSCYIDKNKNSAIVYSGIFTALAFLTKGIAGLFFLPALLIYCLIRKKIMTVFHDKYFWYSVFTFLLIISIWVILIINFGDVNFLKKMFSVDVVGRIMKKENTNFYYRNDPWFIFPALDILFNLWNYLFFTSILIFVLLKIKNRKKIYTPDEHILWICFSIILSLSIILTVAKTSAEWYFSSLVPFCAIVTIVQMDG